MPLARAENRRLVRHPAFITGIVLTPLMLWAATIADHTAREHWRGLSTDVALALVPLGWFTIVATNLLALRPNRTGTVELFAALPAPQPVRTAGALSAMAAAVTAAVLLATGWVILLGARGGTVGTPRLGRDRRRRARGRRSRDRRCRRRSLVAVRGVRGRRRGRRERHPSPVPRRHDMAVEHAPQPPGAVPRFSRRTNLGRRPSTRDQAGLVASRLPRRVDHRHVRRRARP